MDYASFFESKGVGLINASPLGMGLMGNVTPDWHPAPSITRRAVAGARDYAKAKGFNLGIAVHY